MHQGHDGAFAASKNGKSGHASFNVANAQAPSCDPDHWAEKTVRVRGKHGKRLASASFGNIPSNE